MNMHIEILIEDSSGEQLLEYLLPRILGDQGSPHTWRVFSYRGIGRIPQGLQTVADPSKRILLDQLPRILGGYGKTPGIDAVVVIVDSDRRDCRQFLTELRAVVAACPQPPNTLFRLAIEEMEAWYMGDRNALMQAYPKAKTLVLDRYVQDSVCGTWEVLADAVYPGGSNAIAIAGWPRPGQVKHEWANTIGPRMSIDNNSSPSFVKFRDGLRRLIS